ncbi:LysE family translocator [Aliikangiella coralliicola]|uniref:LysE family translocator n=1 Tax=Aliikangiella coralliicola TaxID=2592383 RepID=A0A545U674_9GAMM|nr:LysE family translocator [Aliikangiella coralliicola]TQV84978.1 LysE family translocator [Aliikangiella coralliicola]
MSLLIAMAAFSLAMSISPGPVNMIIISSGVNNGFRRTMPFVSGATIGFTLLLLFIGFGLYQVVTNYPAFLKYLAVAGSAFIIYIGYKIASSLPDLKVSEQNVPKFYEGFLLQWMNPKAWIACVSGVSLFSAPDTHLTLITFVTVYFIVCYASLAVWAILGDRVSIVLNSELRLRIFNIAMGTMLIGTSIYLLYLQLFQ